MAEYNSLRRSGNTTRQIDEWVQKLFKEGKVTIIDHYYDIGSRNMLENPIPQEMAERMLFQRLYTEHRLSLNKEYKFNKITKLVYFT